MSPVGRPGPTAPADPTADTGPRRPPLALVFAITVTGILANTLVFPAVPDILDDLGTSDGAAGLLVAAAAVPGILMAPLIGILADRHGRRPVLVPCLVAFGVFGALAALAPSFPLLLAARFAQGVGAAGLINLANIIIGDHWQGVDRARVYGLNSAVLTVSLAVLPAVGGALTDLGGWRLAFAPYPLAVITAVVVARVLRDGARPAEAPRVRDQARRAVSVVAGDRRLQASISLAFVAFVLIFGLFLTTLPLHLEDEFGLSAGARGLVLAVPALGATVSALSLGRLRRHVGPRTLLLAAFALFAAAFPVVGLVGALVVLLVAAFAYGVAEGLVLPTLVDVAAEVAPGDSRGAVLSAQVGAIRAGQTVGPLLAGVGVTAVGPEGTFVAGAVVAGAAVVAIAVLGPLLRGVGTTDR